MQNVSSFIFGPFDCVYGFTAHTHKYKPYGILYTADSNRCVQTIQHNGFYFESDNRCISLTDHSRLQNSHTQNRHSINTVSTIEKKIKENFRFEMISPTEIFQIQLEI